MIGRRGAEACTSLHHAFFAHSARRTIVLTKRHQSRPLHAWQESGPDHETGCSDLGRAHDTTCSEPKHWVLPRYTNERVTQ